MLQAGEPVMSRQSLPVGKRAIVNAEPAMNQRDAYSGEFLQNEYPVGPPLQFQRGCAAGRPPHVRVSKSLRHSENHAFTFQLRNEGENVGVFIGFENVEIKNLCGFPAII